MCICTVTVGTYCWINAIPILQQMNFFSDMRLQFLSKLCLASHAFQIIRSIWLVSKRKSLHEQYIRFRFRNLESWFCNDIYG